MTEAAHAFLPPSGAHQWGPGGCPASPTMQMHYPEAEETPQNREGTAAHHYLTETLAGRRVEIGSLAPNGHPIDVVMAESAVDYLIDVRSAMAARPGGVLHIERRVGMAAMVHALNWGTPDTYIIYRKERVLHLWDYKYGHRYVDAYGNWQCVDYCIGVLESEGVPVEEWDQWRISVTIAQPRNYHPDGPMREWHFSGQQLLEKSWQLAEAATAAATPGAPMVTGPHCRDCTARHGCPALQQVALALVDMSVSGQPIDLPPDALGTELRVIREALKRLEARETGLTEQALSLARRGVNVPHWRADYSYGRQRWMMTPAEVIALGQNFGIDLAKPTSMTPLQAIKAGIPEDLVKGLTETPRGAMTLVPYDGADIAKRFA